MESRLHVLWPLMRVGEHLPVCAARDGELRRVLNKLFLLQKCPCPFGPELNTVSQKVPGVR